MAFPKSLQILLADLAIDWMGTDTLVSLAGLKATK